MIPNSPGRPRVLIDADVLFAGSASPQSHSASLVVLRMAEITLLEAIVPEQVIIESERNLQEKMPKALPAFRLLVQRCLSIVSNPDSNLLLKHSRQADPKNLPILATAVREQCPWLLTFNLRHYQPGYPNTAAIQPGAFLQQVRYLLSNLKT